jgi:hypothetical protein
VVHPEEALVPISTRPWNAVPKDLRHVWRATPANLGRLRWPGWESGQRLSQHPDRRSSSVATGTLAVGLNVDHVAYVAWWVHPSFSDKTHRLAAELVAFRVLDPALRSRGGIEQSAIDLSEDPRFPSDIEALLVGGAGRQVSASRSVRPGRSCCRD